MDSSFMDDLGACSLKDWHIDACEEQAPLFADNLTALQSLINQKTADNFSKDLIQKELNLESKDLVPIPTKICSDKQFKDFAEKYQSTAN